MKVTLEKNLATDYSVEVSPYIIRLEIENETLDRGHVYQIPVFLRYRSLEKSYIVDICGYRLTARRAEELPELVKQLIYKLISGARLPTYIFVARLARAIFPVYTYGDEVIAFTPHGPAFRHVELAKVREYLDDFLHVAKVLGKDKRDRLHVRGISQKTLALRRPVFYLKKRVVDEVDFWAPVFQSINSHTIYAYAASERQEVVRENGKEVFELRNRVADALIRERRLTNQYDLRPDRLMPDYWERLSSHLQPEDAVTIHGVDIPLFRYEEEWIALEERTEEDRYGLYLGADREDVVRRVAKDFTRRDI